MNKFLSFFSLLLALTFSVFAQSNRAGTFTSAVANLSTNGVSITSFSVTDTSAAQNIVLLYDNEAASTNRTYAAYSVVTVSSTLITNIFTNFAGVSQTNITPVLTSATSVIPLATIQARRVLTLAVPASGTVTITPVDPLGTTFGLTIKATGAGIYNANWINLP